MANGKRKGNNYERDISKALSLWVSLGSRDDIFWRSQNSGARHTTRNKKHMTLEGQSGDIAATCSGPSEAFIKIFCVEIKRYKDINLWGIIKQTKKGILTFWKQAESKAKEVNKVPVLIVKEDFKPALLISVKDLNFLLNKCYGLEPDLVANITGDRLFIWKLEKILNMNSEKLILMIQGESDGSENNKEGAFCTTIT